MPGIARIGDTVEGTCCGNQVVGQIETGSTRHKSDHLGIARLGDTGTYTGCGNHPNDTFTITSASTRHRADSIGIARIGDQVTFQNGTGTIVTGSSRNTAT
jgi:uncharacterized Zn-binding protein involved in type VI secretion